MRAKTYMSQATERYRGKILAIRPSEFPAQDGQIIKGFNLDVKTSEDHGISVWINDDGVIDTKRLHIGDTIDITVEERLRQDGRLKRKLISIDYEDGNGRTVLTETEEIKTENIPF